MFVRDGIVNAMSRLGPARQRKTIRLTTTDISLMQNVADREHIDWSATGRLMIAYALRHMPVGWRPTIYDPLPQTRSDHHGMDARGDQRLHRAGRCAPS